MESLWRRRGTLSTIQLSLRERVGEYCIIIRTAFARVIQMTVNKKLLEQTVTTSLHNKAFNELAAIGKTMLK